MNDELDFEDEFEDEVYLDALEVIEKFKPSDEDEFELPDNWIDPD